jgi:pimeloyl-ACP methyl ester carboxylesterase
MYRGQSDLAEDCQLILADYPGLGGSDLDPASVYGMDLLADRALATLDAAGSQAAAILGTSLGGYVAMAIWKKAPARVRGLILADTRAEGDSAAMATNRHDTVNRLRLEGAGVLRERLANYFAPATREAQPELVREFQGKLDGMPAEALARLTLGLASRPDRRADLAGMQVPVLAVAGTEDSITPPEVVRMLAENSALAQFVMIPGAGHLAPLEKPALFNQVIRGFIRKLQ